MAMTEFTTSNALTVKRWSQSLDVETAKKTYCRKFMGKGDDAVIKIQTELQKAAGDRITIGLRMKLSGYGIEGDNTIEGTSAEEALSFFSDAVYIDQMRKGTKSKGKMSEQRVPYDLRKHGRDALSTWYAELYDELMFMYWSGARGVNSDFKFPTSYTGFAGNSLETPDSDHIIYGGDATGSADLDAADVMNLTLIERLQAKAKTLDPHINAIRMDGKDAYVLVLHPFQTYSLRTSTTTNDWVDIQKNVGQRGDSNLLYKDSLGQYGGVIMHEHRNVIRFSDYGSGSDLSAARALFLGAHSGMMAWGGSAGMGRYSWNEEFDDRGNALAITVGSIFGCKKTRFNSKDFSVVAVDTYAADPNA